MKEERKKLDKSTLGKAIMSLIVGSGVFWITLQIVIIFSVIASGMAGNVVSGFSIPAFLFFITPAIPAGYIVSKTYSNGLVGLAMIGVLSPYFIFLLFVLFTEVSLDIIFYAFPSLNYIALIPIVSMFSALFSRKDFRDKVRKRLG